MKINILIGIIICLLSLDGFSETTYKVDGKKSKLKWLGKKVTGSHTGFIKITKGSLKFEGSNLVAGNFSVDMNSISCTDLDGEWNKKLVGHLKAEDFFNVGKFKNAHFKITDAQLGKGGKYNLVGDLTIRGKTHSVLFDAEITISKNSLRAKSKIVFDRTKYDIKYKSKKFFDPKVLGDKLIYDDVELEIDLKAIK
mgnify:CR=1 FL=1